jgi:hypothetical protein
MKPHFNSERIGAVYDELLGAPGDFPFNPPLPAWGWMNNACGGAVLYAPTAHLELDGIWLETTPLCTTEIPVWCLSDPVY